MMRIGRRHHLHPPGLAYIAVTLLLGVGAINSQNSLLFLIFGAALGGVLMSGALSGAMLMGLDVERHGPVRVTAGQPVTYLYIVRNHNRFIPVFAVCIRELDDGKRGRPRRWSDRLRFGDAFAAFVPPRGSLHIEAPCMPDRRGSASLDRIAAVSTFPFGVLKKSVVFAQPETLLVRPRQVAPRSDWLDTARGATAADGGAGQRAGQGEEFFALREHREGDSPRMIAWRSSAKVDRLLVREHSTPTPTKVWVAIDFAGQDEEHCERAVSVAAGLIDSAIARGLSPGLLAPSVGLTLEPPTNASGAGKASWKSVTLDALARLDLAPTAARAPARVGHRSGFILIVHAGASNVGHWPADATHISADDALTMAQAIGAVA